WTLFMGTTFPWMMAFIRDRLKGEERSFSYLYLANICGAALGAWLTANVLIELHGFNGTLSIAGRLNAVAGLICFLIAAQHGHKARGKRLGAEAPSRSSTRWATDRRLELILFLTGFASMGMEVAWTRGYAGTMGNTVYAFAFILTIYLVGNGAGSVL